MKPHTIRYFLTGIGIIILFDSATPARAWWQFVSLGAQDERKISARYNTKKECNAALKSTEAALRKAYPKRYPLVGSCEEYR